MAATKYLGALIDLFYRLIELVTYSSTAQEAETC